ncbi:Hint domain-containing protein [Rhodophyticola sp. DY48A3-103]|nr:Hint domain-containing protein [Alterinioella nitratireducens]
MTGYLEFEAISGGGTLTPTTVFFDDFIPGSNVNDVNSDGNADAAPPADHYFGPAFPYSGFTISINGHDYAIFEDTLTPGIYYVPYTSSFADLSGLDGTAVTQVITNAGDNAGVANFCFMGGTLIAMPKGERRVEDIGIGDFVMTSDGRAVPVKWLGKQRVTPAAVNLALDEKRAPVRIRAGALGNHSDLYVSADHGMIVEGLVINASALVNGDSIAFVPLAELPESVTYYHVETENHDVILANGAPAETFIDYVGRQAFDNHAEYVALYGCERIIPEMERPRISTARLLPEAIRARLGIGMRVVA